MSLAKRTVTLNNQNVNLITYTQLIENSLTKADNTLQLFLYLFDNQINFFIICLYIYCCDYKSIVHLADYGSVYSVNCIKITT